MVDKMQQHPFWDEVETRLKADRRNWAWLAEELGWEYPRVTSARRREPRLQRIVDIAVALKCAPSDLMGGVK
jgi:hypothetical protein